MSNAKGKPCHTIEYYKSELIKKDEMIEKLLEEDNKNKVKVLRSYKIKKVFGN